MGSTTYACIKATTCQKLCRDPVPLRYFWIPVCRIHFYAGGEGEFAAETAALHSQRLHQEIASECCAQPVVPQLHNSDYYRLRHRSTLTGSANHDNSGSSHGTVLSRGPGRASGWFARRARKQSTPTRLIVARRKTASHLEIRIVMV